MATTIFVVFVDVFIVAVVVVGASVFIPILAVDVFMIFVFLSIMPAVGMAVFIVCLVVVIIIVVSMAIYAVIVVFDVLFVSLLTSLASRKLLALELHSSLSPSSSWMRNLSRYWHCSQF